MNALFAPRGPLPRATTSDTKIAAILRGRHSEKHESQPIAVLIRASHARRPR